MDKKTLDRLIEKIDIDGPLIEGMGECCFEWKGCVDDKGRPRFFYNGTGGLARRAFYEAIIESALPDGVQVMAICRNPKCMNPAHLFAATEHDAHALAGYSNLSPNGIVNLRKVMGETGISAEELAVTFRLSEPLMLRVVAG